MKCEKPSGQESILGRHEGRQRLACSCLPDPYWQLCSCISARAVSGNADRLETGQGREGMDHFHWWSLVAEQVKLVSGRWL